MKTNYHSHCHFCDGSNPPEDYVISAIEKGFDVYGFSSHIPLKNFESAWNMKKSNFELYLKTIAELKQKYDGQIEILCAFETDFELSLYSRNELREKYPQVDYTVGSIHYIDYFQDGNPWEMDGDTNLFEKGLNEIFEGNIQKAVKRYYELTRKMLINEGPEILGHADKIKMHNGKKPFFDENEKWYQDEIEELLDCVLKTETILEINTRGLYKSKTPDFYPSQSMLKRAAELKIPMQINSDAHRPEELDLYFEEAKNFLKSIGVKSQRIYSESAWLDTGF